MTADMTLAEPDWWLDAHLDLAYLDLHGPAVDADAPDRAARGVSLPALARGRVRIALGTIFTEHGAATDPWGYRDSDDLDGAHAAGVRQLEVYERLERAGRVRIVRTAADLDACAAAPTGAPPGIVILMECADPIRTPDEAAWWHARGVRVVGMSWGHGSRWAGGNARPGPLTAAGRRLVQAFDALGILHDASHLSDAAFDGLCEATGRTIVLTHSNARALLSPSERHATDAQLREVARRGGVAGLNLYGKFLASGRPATLDDAVRHVMHVGEVAGRAHVGLGSDFDGGFLPADCPPGCGRPEELDALARALAAHGMGARDVEAFAHGNWMRALRAAFGGSGGAGAS
jgi:membrane dipeptidase